MSSLTSWLGSIASLVVFFSVRFFTAGLVAPTFLAAVFAVVFTWKYVLKVPELPKAPQAKDDEPASAVPPEQTADHSSQRGSRAEHGSQPVSETPQAPAPELVKPAEAEEARGEAADPTPEESAGSSCGSRSRARSASDGHLAAAAPSCTAATADGEAKDSSHFDCGPAAASNAGSDWGGGDSEAEDEAQTRIGKALEVAKDPEKAAELRQQGNDLFKAGKLHDAREAYSEAIFLMPSASSQEKAILHANRAACWQRLGRWEDVIEDCKVAIELDPSYLKAYCRRSAAYEAQNKWHDALEDLKKAIELDPSLKSKEYRREAMLETRSQEQFEKDKEEMMGKLKDIGNSILGKFGMSTDNFKLEQDPNTGGYSMKYSG